MSGVNKVILIGRLGKDPEVRYLENGTCVANFSMATSETYKDRTSGEKREITEWHNIVIWRGLAEVAEKYLKKGAQVYIEGRLRTRSWERDGITRYTTEVVTDNMTMLGGKSNSARPPLPDEHDPYANAVEASGEASGGNEEESDDLPF